MVGGVEADAHDALQETWIRACKSMERFEWQSSLRTWLTGILINCVRERDRRQRHRSENELPEENLLSTTPPAQGVLDLEQIIDRLPAGYRQVLTLHDIEGYTHEEIGRLLEISPGTSKSQLFQARKTMRASLEGERK